MSEVLVGRIPRRMTTIDAPMKLALAVEAGAKDESECGVATFSTPAAPCSSLGKMPLFRFASSGDHWKRVGV